MKVISPYTSFICTMSFDVVTFKGTNVSIQRFDGI